jgi:hypothetical protein
MKGSTSAFRGLCGLGSLALLLSLALVSALAEDPRFPNSEDLRHIKGIAGPLLSPDGAEVLFTMTDATADGCCGGRRGASAYFVSGGG